jgi:hypothetical protein
MAMMMRNRARQYDYCLWWEGEEGSVLGAFSLALRPLPPLIVVPIMVDQEKASFANEAADDSIT